MPSTNIHVHKFLNLKFTSNYFSYLHHTPAYAKNLLLKAHKTTRTSYILRKSPILYIFSKVVAWLLTTANILN